MTTAKRIKAIYYGKPYHLGVFENIPAKEIRMVTYPRITQNAFVRHSDIHRHTVRAVEDGNKSYHLKSLVEYLKAFNLKLVLYKDGKYFSGNLNLFDLVELDKDLDVRGMCEDIGVHENYFNDRRDNYRIDPFRDIVDYLGYSLAIVSVRGLG